MGPTQPVHLSTEVEAILSHLLSDDTRFYSSEQVGRRLATTNSAPDLKAVATEARKARCIVGVWDGEKYRYPIFQFDSTGQPLADMAALIAVLPRDIDGSNRAAILWLFAPTLALSGRTPAETFREDPMRVLASARHWREGGPR